MKLFVEVTVEQSTGIIGNPRTRMGRTKGKFKVNVLDSLVLQFKFCF